MSSIIRVRRGDMVVSFRRCSDGLLHVRRFERITLLPTQAARPTSSAQPFRPTVSEWDSVRKPQGFSKGLSILVPYPYASQKASGRTNSVRKQRGGDPADRPGAPAGSGRGGADDESSPPS